MTATTRFERHVTIHRDSGDIYAEVADPQRQLGLQPLLESVEECEGGEPDRIRLFEAVEAVPILGGIKWRNRIRVRIDLTRPGEIIEFEARSFPGIVVRSRFTLSEVATGTLVREEVRLSAPFPIHGFVRSQALQAQERLLENLKRRMEMRSLPGGGS